MTYSLALSLGHNSSAILIQDGRVLAGYEEERFTGIKADSRFPIQSLMTLHHEFMLPKDTDVYVGHWFIDSQLPPPNKYWDPKLIRSLYPNGSIDSLSPDFTHHDSHLESAIVFAGKNFANRYTAVVADGFGSFGECISIYEVSGNSYKLSNRIFGFEKSLGMLYQYATAYMGMKMHNHEYKMLAYEVHIGEVLDVDEIARLDMLVSEQASRYLKSFHNGRLTSEFDPVTDLAALPNVQRMINGILDDMLKAIGHELAPEWERRVIVSYFVQHVVEAVMVTHHQMFSQSENLLVVGGLFYNVKLNHLLANRIKGKFCAMPLAGDQGAALGVYQAYKGDLQWPDHLFWGKRDLTSLKNVDEKGLIYFDRQSDDALEAVSSQLTHNGWVNVVRGAMEFGPRSLCHTATLALPEILVTENINRANDRTAEMPMAPVMTYSQAEQHFYDVNKIHKSLEYMICARQYQGGMERKVMGAAHHYPKENVYTGRPQITGDSFMNELLNYFGPLVNTSFNYHGVPIVRSAADVLDSHRKQWAKAPDLEPTTIVIGD